MAPQREWFEKDYYKVLGVDVDGDREGHHARVPEAGEAVPPRRESGRRRSRGALQGSVGGATKCCPTPRSARSTTRSARWWPKAWARAARRLRWRLRAGRLRRGRPDLQLRGPRRTRRSLRQPLRRWRCAGGGRRRGRRGPVGPAPRRRHRGRVAPRLPRRGARHHHERALHVRRGVSRVPRHRAPSPAPRPRRAPRVAAPATCSSTRVRSRSRRCARSAVVAAQIVKDKCKNCKGRGVEVRPREVKVKVPAGVQGGQRIKVAGRGAPGHNGGPPGDLFVVVHVAHHPVFGRSGKTNLTVKVPVTYRRGRVRRAGEGADARRRRSPSR